MTVQTNALIVANALGDPSKFTTIVYARNKEGHAVSVHSKEAVCWCADGLAQLLLGEEKANNLRRAFYTYKGVSIISINDSNGLFAIKTALKDFAEKYHE